MTTRNRNTANNPASAKNPTTSATDIEKIRAELKREMQAEAQAEKETAIKRILSAVGSKASKQAALKAIDATKEQINEAQTVRAYNAQASALFAIAKSGNALPTGSTVVERDANLLSAMQATGFYKKDRLSNSGTWLDVLSLMRKLYEADSSAS